MASVQDITDFTAVDKTKDPHFYQIFLDRVNNHPAIQPSKRIILDGLRLEPGQRVLDVGCGLGHDAFAIAERVGPRGHVVGVDISEVMVEEARRRKLPESPVEFQIGDARKLPFPSGHFDAVRAERLLMHVPEASVALAEMLRVLRPGRRLCIFDFDWDTFVVDRPAKDITRAVVLSFSDHMKNGWIGRSLPRMFAENNVRDVHTVVEFVFVDFDLMGLLVGGHLHKMGAEGTIDAAALKDWWNGLAQADQAASFLAGFAAFIVSGTK